MGIFNIKTRRKSVIFIDEKTKPGMAEILSEAAKRNGASVQEIMINKISRKDSGRACWLKCLRPKRIFVKRKNGQKIIREGVIDFS